jgi:protein-tyrosine phosphatase|nr:low molecular weight protein-tyrosine-phosphatase [Crenothrix polyspora]
MTTTNVLFVCMGNICRSPTAEGVFAKLVKDNRVDNHFVIDSAGTHAYHIGDAPDLRSQKAASDRGVALSHLRARKVNITDFEKFDFILAMDAENHANLMALCPDSHKTKVQYFLDYAPQLKTREVPDPYYGGKYGFEKVLDMIEAAALGFLAHVQKTGHVK